MPIRQRRPPTEEFIEEFQKTIVPSAIPSSEFIDWEGISKQIDEYEEQIETISDLRGVSEKEFVEGLTDALMEGNDTREWIDFYFEALGERGKKYSAYEGVWKFYDIQGAIDSGDREEARDLAEVLQNIGLQYLVDTCGDIRDHFRGMLVGMETHARKNRQGVCFESLVEERVEHCVKDTTLRWMTNTLPNTRTKQVSRRLLTSQFLRRVTYVWFSRQTATRQGAVSLLRYVVLTTT